MHDEGNTRPQASKAPLAEVGCAVFAAPAPVGPIWLAWVPAGLAVLHFGPDAPEADRARFWPEGEGLAPGDVPPELHARLVRYFDGEDEDPADWPVRIGGTAFQGRAWKALRRVPRGEVRTYAGLARDVGSPRAMRAIGMAMNANPVAIAVPCHRIVGAGRTLGGFGGGPDRKRFLLELEGARVDGDRVLMGQLDLL